MSLKLIVIFILVILNSCQLNPQKEGYRDPSHNDRSSINGESTIYHDNSEIKIKQQFLSGDLDGTWKEWNESGILIRSCNYNKNKLHGTDSAYYGTGILKSVYEYQNGVRIEDQYIWYENGNLQSHRKYKDGIATGPDTIWHDNKVIKQIGYYIQNLPHGKFIQFSYTGTKEFEGKYFGGKENGIWYIYDSNGKRIQENHYDKGKLVKEFRVK